MNTRTGQHKMRLTLLALSLTLIVLGVMLAPPLTPTAHAANLVVSTLADTGAGSLRDAITTANGNASADTITFSVSGKITLSSALPALSDASGLTIDGGANIIIDGAGAYQIFNMSAGYLELKNLTLQNGYSDWGAAVNNNSATDVLLITNVTFLNNTRGGAIYSTTTGTSRVSNSTFSGNTKTVNNNSGSAISAEGSGGFQIANTVFTNNLNDYNGGTITLKTAGKSVTIANSTFSGNTGVEGIVFNLSANLSIETSTFSGNTVNSAYGTLYTASASGYNTWVGNTIIANTLTGQNCATIAGSILPVNGGNNIDDGTSCGFGSTDGAMSGTNPQLDPFTNGVFPLKPNSPAIDNGKAATCADTRTNNVDQRGQARNDLGCDIGAYERVITDSNYAVLLPSTTMTTTFGPARVGISDTVGATNHPGVITATKVLNWTGGTPAGTLGAFWDLTPATNTNLNLALQLCYSTAEVGNLSTETGAHFWRYDGSWHDAGAVASFTGASPNRCANISGVTDLSRWTITTGGSPANTPTAVTLSSFKANAPFDLGTLLRKLLGQ